MNEEVNEPCSEHPDSVHTSSTCMAIIRTQKCKTSTSPPNFFTPRFLGFESRPFFVEPAVFLEAQRLNTILKPSPDTSTIMGQKIISLAYFRKTSYSSQYRIMRLYHWCFYTQEHLSQVPWHSIFCKMMLQNSWCFLCGRDTTWDKL